jgi:hypothetical protein
VKKGVFSLRARPVSDRGYLARKLGSADGAASLCLGTGAALLAQVAHAACEGNARFGLRNVLSHSNLNSGLVGPLVVVALFDRLQGKYDLHCLTPKSGFISVQALEDAAVQVRKTQ